MILRTLRDCYNSCFSGWEGGRKMAPRGHLHSKVDIMLEYKNMKKGGFSRIFSKSYPNPVFIVYKKHKPYLVCFISLKKTPFFLIFAVFDTLNTASAVRASPWKNTFFYVFVLENDTHLWIQVPPGCHLPSPPPATVRWVVNNPAMFTILTIPFFQLIKQLTSQKARHNFLTMAFELERRDHKDTHLILTGTELLLEKNATFLPPLSHCKMSCNNLAVFTMLTIISFQLIKQLTSQKARHDFLTMAFELERRGHKDTHRLLTGTELLLEKNAKANQDRMVSFVYWLINALLKN